MPEITITLSPQSYARLEELQKLVGAASPLDLFEPAFRLYEVAIRHVATRGGKIEMSYRDGRRTALMHASAEISAAIEFYTVVSPLEEIARKRKEKHEPQ